MKILIIRTSSDGVNFNVNTYNRQEIGLAKAFNKQGHVCDVAYFGGRENKKIQLEYGKDKYFTVYLVPGISVLKNGIFIGIDKLVENYDLIQPGGYDQLESWRLARKYPEKTVIFHGTYYKEFNKGYNFKCKWFDRFFLKTYIRKNIHFATKSNMAANFLRKKGISNVTTVGVGLDLEQISSVVDEESDISRGMINLKNSEKKLLLYIGRLEERRNLFFLLDVFNRILLERGNVYFVIIGNGETQYKNKFLSRIAELGISDNVIYREKLEQKFLPLIYKSCDIFLLPTLYEIFGMVLLEAMYFGTPVVTTLNGGSDLLIENQKSGIIIENCETSVWKDTIFRLLNDPGYLSYMGKIAHEQIATMYTWDALVDRFVDIYQNKNILRAL